MEEEQNPCRGCKRGFCFVDEFCMSCNGTGKAIDITIGLNVAGLVPAYLEKECPQCKGVGFIRWACQVYLNDDWG